MQIKLVSARAITFALAAWGVTSVYPNASNAAESVETSTSQSPWSSKHFGPSDVFELEWVSDPQVSPNGREIIYIRRSFDVMSDRAISTLWLVDASGHNHEPLVPSFKGVSSPRWSPDGKKLLFVSSTANGAQLHIHWLASNRTTAISHVRKSPMNPTWSPDGKSIAFTMQVEAKSKPLITMPPKPKNAKWAPPAKVIDQVIYRADGRGYLQPSHTHVFMIPAIGGTPVRLTSGDYDFGAPSWDKDGQKLYASATSKKDFINQFNNSEIYEIDTQSKKQTQLTHRNGPDAGPMVSPNGKWIAYFGYDDKRLGYQLNQLYIMDKSGKNPRSLTQTLDRTIEQAKWASDSRGLYIKYSDFGDTKLAKIDLNGKVQPITQNVGGTSVGRPYSSGQFSVGQKTLAFTQTSPQRPGDLVVIRKGQPTTLVQLNEDLLGQKDLASVEEISVKTEDGASIQAWVAKPPNFDPQKKYPMILEIHGGPFANYGPRFSAEIQLYCSAGYVVLYANPRGSTSYGAKFGNSIHHAYPGVDYGDLMASVDKTLSQGYIDPDRLFITGGSGGGTLTAWTIGKTQRFKAAVVAKPVINWMSFVLYSDFYPFFSQYWFPTMPWEDAEHYFKRSPLSLVGNVNTPTMLLTGEVDYRTPIAESEQFYQALKLRNIDATLVRIGGASHSIASRPSHLISKVLHILSWFGEYDVTPSK